MLYYHHFGVGYKLDTHTRNVILLFEYKHVKERKLVNLKFFFYYYLSTFIYSYDKYQHK